MDEFIFKLSSCKKCPNMIGPPIIGSVKETSIISIGQAPGIHEKKFMKPFSWTAGKTLFKWLARIQIIEEDFRQKVNMSAVCRCFPGKAANGDRKPNSTEIENCAEYLNFEFQYHKPLLVIPIGKMAIDQFMKGEKYKLEEIIGRSFKGKREGVEFDWIPLPHPSGLNVWNNTIKGKKLIAEALELIRKHQAIQSIFFNG